LRPALHSQGQGIVIGVEARLKKHALHCIQGGGGGRGCVRVGATKQAFMGVSQARCVTVRANIRVLEQTCVDA
jgi:hypothetical protein